MFYISKLIVHETQKLAMFKRADIKKNKTLFCTQKYYLFTRLIG